MNKKRELSNLSRGDIILLTNEQECEFIRLKRTRFIGIIDGTSYDIPVDNFKEVIEKVEQEKVDDLLGDLSAGDYFYIDNKGTAELYMYKQLNKNKIIAQNPISKGKVRIDKEMFVEKI